MLFTKEHQWVKVQGLVGTLGITKYAAGELQDVTFVNLPAVGKSFARGETLCTVEAVKASSDIPAPFSCSVSAINAKVVESPELVGEDPEGEGWLLVLEIKNPLELEELMKSPFQES